MKFTGMARNVDGLGRFVIPKEMREQLEIKTKDRISIYMEGEKIILQKNQDSCLFCGNEENLTEYKDKMICNECVEKIKVIK